MADEKPIPPKQTQPTSDPKQKAVLGSEQRSQDIVKMSINPKASVDLGKVHYSDDSER